MDHHAGLARSLSRQLNVLRGHRKQAEIALLMRCSNAKVSRIFDENCDQAPPWSDLQLLLTILDADADTRERIICAWEALRITPAALINYTDILSRPQREYYEALQVADVLRIQTGAALPMMMRSLDYQMAMMTPEEKMLQGHRWHQLLALMNESRNPARQIHLIMCESALLRWRTPGFHESLDLMLTAHENGVVIQFYPLSAPLRPGLLHPFTILEWHHDPQLSQGAVFLMHPPGVVWATRHELPFLHRSWNELSAGSTDPRQLPAIIQRADRQTVDIRWDDLIA